MIQGNFSPKTAAKLVVNRDDCMRSLQKNLSICMGSMHMSLNEFSEYVEVPYSTLNSIVYGKPKDIKLSTVLSIARKLNISLDELLGAGTMEDIMRESIRLARELPDHALYLIRYVIRHQAILYSGIGCTCKNISIIRPQLINGIIATTNVSEFYCIDHLPEEIKSKAYLGMVIPCDYYMPHYLPGEIILVAADREERNGERCLVTRSGGIYIVIREHIIRNGIKEQKYAPLMSRNVILPDGIIDDKLGYIVGFLNRDGSWGIR